MLTIKNYSKLFRKDVFLYRVAKILENELDYQIKLVSEQGHSLMIYLERNAIDNQYEMWYQGMNAERLWFEKDKFETIDKFIGCMKLLIG
jgi:hypothetical protein